MSIIEVTLADGTVVCKLDTELMECYTTEVQQIMQKYKINEAQTLEERRARTNAALLEISKFLSGKPRKINRKEHKRREQQLRKSEFVSALSIIGTRTILPHTD